MQRAAYLRRLSVLALSALALACGDKRVFDTPETVPAPPAEPAPVPGEHFATSPPPGMVGRIAYIAIEGSMVHPFIMDPDGNNTRNLLPSDSIYDFSGPSWSPDATKLAFASNLDGNAVWNIYTMNVDGTGITKVVDRPDTRDFAPSWSPDGQKIAFQSVEDSDNGFDIFLYDSVTDTVTNLTDRPGDDELASWSPDGTKIVFQSSRPGGDGTDIWLMDADGNNAVQLTDSANVQSSAPTFSPDGALIAFESTLHAPITGPDATGDFEIYVMKPDGSNIQRLTVGVGFGDDARFPTWSPDGRHIAYEFWNHTTGAFFPRSAIVVMNADGSNEYMVPNQPLDGRFPRWSPR